jgi:hypothetical protein
MFSKDGIIQWNKIEEDRASKFHYQDVLPDTAGDVCGIWYQNLVIPEE